LDGTVIYGNLHRKLPASDLTMAGLAMASGPFQPNKLPSTPHPYGITSNTGSPKLQNAKPST